MKYVIKESMEYDIKGTILKLMHEIEEKQIELENIQKLVIENIKFKSKL